MSHIQIGQITHCIIGCLWTTRFEDRSLPMHGMINLSLLCLKDSSNNINFADIMHFVKIIRFKLIFKI